MRRDVYNRIGEVSVIVEGLILKRRKTFKAELGGRIMGKKTDAGEGNDRKRAAALKTSGSHQGVERKTLDSAETLSSFCCNACRLSCTYPTNTFPRKDTKHKRVSTLSDATDSP